MQALHVILTLFLALGGMTKNAEHNVSVLKKVFRHGMSYERAAREMDCAPNTVKNIVERYQHKGLVAAMGQRGCQHYDRKFSPHTLEELRKIVARNDSLYAKQMARELHSATGLFYTPKDIHFALKQLNMSRKVRTKHNNRSDPAKVEQFKAEVSQYPFWRFMWSDEAAFSRQEGIRRCACSYRLAASPVCCASWRLLRF